ncbi:hypothetical protein O181_060245 [Austropuccinia psidii MF-1]|uniref:Uncharacterized protein n=1 Tax=Austropuccinia psidii MF-1 TaxID=1389203 RepID=A0A9Q3ED09_9BASI|nr:hypothetical protein [Austropuccinia psidii MF-1]
MNVSGLKIDMGNLKAQTSSTWSIPNIPVTPIPLNPTNTQRDVPEGLESTPQISSKANPQQKFPCEFLLNPGQNPVASQDPFEKSKQPTLNIPSGSQVHVGNENPVDGGNKKDHWKNVTQSDVAPKGKSVRSQEPIEDRDEIYVSSPLVHKEKVTGRHHSYASKPRLGHSSSPRENIVDDEDEKMSPTQSEKNDEPRRDNFMAHEQGTQSSSEFTHPQIPLAHSMLNQSEMRQQRNKAHKAHNVAKLANQKEQQKWLKVELPENVHGMRSAVHAHCLFLLKVRDKYFSSLPEPPSTEEQEIEIQVAGHLGYFPKDFFNQPSTQVQSQGFQSYCKNEIHKLGLKKFTWDWESSLQHLFNDLKSMVLYCKFCLALVSTKYHHYCWSKDHNNYGVVAALMEQCFTYLKREWRSIQNDADYLVKKKDNQKLTNICQRVSYFISSSL